MSRQLRRSARTGPTRWEKLSFSVPAGVQVAIAFGAVLVVLSLVGGVVIYHRDYSHAKWIGSTEADLVASRGAPQWEGTDRDGRRILVYERVRDTDEGTKILHTVVYVEKGEQITAISSLLAGGYNRVSKYDST